AGHLGGAARKAARSGDARLEAGAQAVEQAHAALDHDAVGPDDALREGTPHPVVAEQPGVEVAAGTAARVGEICAVDEVRTDLERLHGAAAAEERCHEPEGDRRL